MLAYLNMREKPCHTPPWRRACKQSACRKKLLVQSSDARVKDLQCHILKGLLAAKPPWNRVCMYVCNASCGDFLLPFQRTLAGCALTIQTSHGLSRPAQSGRYALLAATLLACSCWITRPVSAGAGKASTRICDVCHRHSRCCSRLGAIR